MRTKNKTVFPAAFFSWFKKIEISLVAAEDPPPHFQTILASGEKAWRRVGRPPQTFWRGRLSPESRCTAIRFTIFFDTLMKTIIKVKMFWRMRMFDVNLGG